eukprot:1151759-Pelagomonas_calceolata.AAC.3
MPLTPVSPRKQVELLVCEHSHLNFLQGLMQGCFMVSQVHMQGKSERFSVSGVVKINAAQMQMPIECRTNRCKCQLSSRCRWQTAGMTNVSACGMRVVVLPTFVARDIHIFTTSRRYENHP